MSIDWLLIHSPALIIAIPLFAAFAMPLIKKLGNKTRNGVALATVLLIEILVIMLAKDVFASGARSYVFGAGPGLTLPSGYIVPVRILFHVDGMSAFMAIISATIALVAVIYSLKFMEKETALDRYYLLLLLMLVGMFGMEFTADLFNMFVFLEVLSIASCGLVAYRIHLADAPEGALKFMVISSIGALMVLLATGFLYGQYDALNIAQLAKELQFNFIDKIALVLLLGAFAMKCGSFPMHQWVPDTYSVAPAPISILLVVSTQVSLYALLRVVFTLYGISSNVVVVGWYLIVLGLSTLFIGVTMAIPQRDIKRLISYLGVSQIGYMLIAVGVGFSLFANPVEFEIYGFRAIEGGIFQLINDSMYMGLLFLVSGALYYRIGTRNLDSMGGLARPMKVTSICFLIGSLAIAGIPPFNGFASKFMIYETVYRFNPIISIVAMLVSVLTLAAMVRAFSAAFMGPSLPEFKEAREVPKSMILGMVILASIVVFFGLFPSLIVDNLVEPAVRALISRPSYIVSLLGG
jgi:multicomponent Na+:H+ antiporter subunit D